MAYTVMLSTLALFDGYFIFIFPCLFIIGLPNAMYGPTITSYNVNKYEILVAFSFITLGLL